MPVLCIMRGPDVTPDDYDNVRGYLGWEARPPQGGMGHLISFDAGECLEIDIWESADSFWLFYQTALAPAFAHFGLRVTEPEVRELHNIALSEVVRTHFLPSTAAPRFTHA